MQITANWSRWKPEVEFQYSGRLYLETGSSYISAANGDRLWPFEDSDINKYEPKLLFSGRGRRLEKWKWRHISAYFGIEQLYTGNLLTVVLAHYTHS